MTESGQHKYSQTDHALGPMHQPLYALFQHRLVLEQHLGDKVREKRE
jgi:hypothetical protein